MYAGAIYRGAPPPRPRRRPPRRLGLGSWPWSKKHWYYIDAWQQFDDGAWSKRHDEGPVKYTTDDATSRYLDVREENWNAQLIRKYRWNGQSWEQEA